MHPDTRSPAAVLASVLLLGACGGGGGGPAGDGFGDEDRTRAQLVSTMTSLTALAASSVGDPGVKRKPAERCTSEHVSCPGGGSIDLDCGAAEIAFVFDDCRSGTQRVDGAMRARLVGTTLTIDIDELTASYGACGIFTMDGRITGTHSATGSSLGYDVTVSSGDEQVAIDGTLTWNNIGRIDGRLGFSGQIQASCDFEQTYSGCDQIAEACGLDAMEICEGSAFRTDICTAPE